MWEFIGNNLGLIFGILSGLIGIVATILSFVKKDSKGAKILKGLAKVINSFPEIIQTAEKIGGTGEDKKTFVMQQGVLLCQALGFEPTEVQLAEMSDIIDRLVTLSKSINQHSKGTTTLTKLNPIGGGDNAN